MNILKGQHWAVIPSRANSQRFPEKALTILCGETLIDRAIKTVLSTKRIDHVVVSTNDKKLSKRLPVSVMVHWRPDEYAQPDTRIDDTLINMVENLDECGEFLHLVQLTSPFIHYSYIETGINLLETRKDIDSAQLVTKVSNANHAFSQRHINDNGDIQFCYREDRDKNYNSQRKPSRYVFAGYVGFRVVSLLKYGTIWGERSLPIIGGTECAIDIDTEEDLEYAEFYLRKKKGEVKYAFA